MKDEQAAAHPHGKAGNIEKTISFSFENVPEGDAKVVGKHIGNFDESGYPCPAQWPCHSVNPYSAVSQ